MTLESAQQRPAAARRALHPPRGTAAALVAFVPVVGLAGAQGGYFPSSWGWATFPLLWVAALALLLRGRVRLSQSERLFLVLLVAFTAWIFVSATWSVAAADSILEAQRGLLYAAAITATLLMARSTNVPQVLAGVLAATCTIAAFALATRLLPDRIGVFDASAVYRLAQPIGYWNGLAIFTGMGALLAWVFALRAHLVAVRAACAAALVLLLPTMYFTFGRATWIALGVGVLAAVAVDPRRLQLLAGLLCLAPVPALAVWAASREPGLTDASARYMRVVHDGHRFALLLVALGGANAVAGTVFALAGRRFDPPRTARRAFGAVLVLLVAAGLATIFVRYGGPATLAEKGYRAFKAPPPHVEGRLSKRLLSFSGNGRADLWRLAWDDAREHPVLGAGAGTYERYFLAHQPAGISRVRDAHGLYVETLAELGPLGLVVLLLALAVPLGALGAARSHPLVPGAAAAYTAYLVHTGVDWDWELHAVTLAGLLCGASILLAARARGAAPVRSRARWTAVAVIVAAAAFAAVGLLGNAALSRSDKDRRSQDWAGAADNARRAKTLMPWSPRPYEALGRAQLGAGFPTAARMSFRKAISIDPGDWELWYRLASASSGQARESGLRHATRLYPRAKLVREARGGQKKP